MTPTDITDELWTQHKIRVDRRKIGTDTIKRIGRYQVPIELFQDVTAELRTLVVPEGGELPPEEELEAMEAAERPKRTSRPRRRRSTSSHSTSSTRLRSLRSRSSRPAARSSRPARTSRASYRTTTSTARSTPARPTSSSRAKAPLAAPHRGRASRARAAVQPNSLGSRPHRADSSSGLAAPDRVNAGASAAASETRATATLIPQSCPAAEAVSTHFCAEPWDKLAQAFPLVCELRRTSRSLRQNHQQAPSGAYGNIRSFHLQTAANSPVENVVINRWKPVRKGGSLRPRDTCRPAR